MSLPPGFDPSRKFVRITELRSDGFVEFDFAVGEPELFVEMILPSAGFDEFCALNKVKFIDDKSRLKIDRSLDGEEAAEWEWNLHAATHQRFKSHE